MIIATFGALIATLFVDVALIGLGYVLGDTLPLSVSITMGAIAAATAPAATLMVVKQYKAKGPVTDILLPVVALDDAVGLIAFAVSMVKRPSSSPLFPCFQHQSPSGSFQTSKYLIRPLKCSAVAFT